ncbi:hypothetical protein ACP70R_030761 [Stipagrostis hirtigluma subsp. patula]
MLALRCKPLSLPITLTSGDGHCAPVFHLEPYSEMFLGLRNDPDAPTTELPVPFTLPCFPQLEPKRISPSELVLCSSPAAPRNHVPSPQEKHGVHPCERDSFRRSCVIWQRLRGVVGRNEVPCANSRTRGSGELGLSETKIVARLFDADEEVDVKVLRRDVARDIALLELTTPGARPRLMLDERVAPPVGTVVVALAYFVPDTPEGVPFVYPDEPGSAPGKISSDPGQEFGKSTGKFAEVIAATCGTIQGCSGGPLILDHKVLGILTTGRHQVSVFVTARTVRSVFLGWLNHEEGDDGPSMEDLTRLLSGL